MQNAIVTGASSGIGLGCAQRLATDGYRVWAIARNIDALNKLATDYPAVLPTACDLTNVREIEALGYRLPDAVNVLVHSAGGNVEIGAGTTESLDEVATRWIDNYWLNVISAVLLTEVVNERFALGASLITIGSIAAHTGAGSYGAAKSAQRAWIMDQAEELGAKVGGTANLVSPGLTMETNFFKGLLTEERIVSLTESTLVKRVSAVEDVVACCAFLWSESGRQITGQTLHVNGGAFVSP